MPTQLFRGTTLDDAVRAARRDVGTTFKVVSATRVRNGGVAGFFAHEHVEVEVEVPTRGSAPSTAGKPVQAQPAPAKKAPPWEAPQKQAPQKQAPLYGAAPKQAAPKDSRTWRARPDPLQELLGTDPMQELVEEMATKAPSSVLDLAEKLNAVESERASAARARPHFSLGAPAKPKPARDDGFASVLERIAKESGLTVPSFELTESAPSVPVHHADALLVDLDRHMAPSPERPASTPTTRLLADLDRHMAPSPERPASTPTSSPTARLLADLDRHTTASPERPAWQPSERSLPERAPSGRSLPERMRPERSVPARRTGGLERSLQNLGVPPEVCESVLPSASPDGLVAELARALGTALPPLPCLPRSTSSVVAVIGPAKHVMNTARALAAEIGTPPGEVTLATQRKTWTQRNDVISSADEATEHRRSWRWRPRPAIVAVEEPVRPRTSDWSTALLQALEPVVCWGVAEASHKPEDLATWSDALGGLDALALVDLEGTSTPAAALTCPVPVGRLDGGLATAEAWAKLLCARIVA